MTKEIESWWEDKVPPLHSKEATSRFYTVVCLVCSGQQVVDMVERPLGTELDLICPFCGDWQNHKVTGVLKDENVGLA